MQQFSSLNQWQGGSQEAGWYKPFHHDPIRLYVDVDVKWDRRAMNLQQHISLVICTQQHVITHSSVQQVRYHGFPLMFFFSDRDNKLITCTAETPG